MGYRALIGLGVALTSLALMSAELVLTRIFSVVVWYHFAFFAISVALFGSGAAAVVVQLVQRRLPPALTDQVLAASACLLSVTLFGVDVVLVTVTPDWFAGASQFTTLTGRLLLTFVLAAAPFFVGGLTVSLALSRYAISAHRLYSWDLAGAAAACVLVVPALGGLGGPGALVAAGSVAAVAAFAFALSLVGRRRTVWTSVALVLAGGLAVTSVVAPRSGWLRVRVAKGVDLGKIPPEFHRWNAFSTVTVLPGMGFRGWGMSPRYDGPVPPQKTLVIDMNAMTTLTQFDGSLDDVRYTSFDLSALVWGIRSDTAHACVIGAGGGKDVLAALAGGARQVTAVEINPLIVDGVMRGQFRDFVGDLYGRDDVDVHVADGRTFVRATDQKFDVILLSMVDTSAATAAGAYALTENGLYTADAFRDFFDKLRPGGMLSVSTASLEGLAVGARLAAIAREVVKERGGEPARSVAVADATWLAGHGTTLHEVVVKPEGFSPAEAQAFLRLSVERGFVPVFVPGQVVSPVGPEQAVIQRILTADDDAALSAELSRLPLDVTPVDDDRPFFFYQNRLADFPQALLATGTSHLFGNGLVILAKVLLIALLLTATFIGVPIALRRDELRRGYGAPLWDLSYVTCLGLGFMFLEIGAIQRLSIYLGHPTYTLAVVLFVLLLSGSAGSRMFARVSAERRRTVLPTVLAAIAGYGVLLAVASGPLLHATATLAAEGRAAVSAALLAPLGLVLGIPFPSGLAVIGARAEARLPWLISVNSATSVLGSIVATLVALHAGIPEVSLVGAALYGVAAAIWPRVARVPATHLAKTMPAVTPQAS